MHVHPIHTKDIYRTKLAEWVGIILGHIVSVYHKYVSNPNKASKHTIIRNIGSSVYVGTGWLPRCIVLCGLGSLTMYAVKNSPRKRRNIPQNLVKPSKQQKRIKVDRVSGTVPQASTVPRIQVWSLHLAMSVIMNLTSVDLITFLIPCSYRVLHTLREKKKPLQSGMKFIKLL